MRDAAIVATARTPVGKAFRASLNDTHGAVMSAHVIGAAVARASLDSAEIEAVLLGTAGPEGPTGSNIAEVPRCGQACPSPWPAAAFVERLSRICTNVVRLIARPETAIRPLQRKSKRSVKPLAILTP